MGNSQLAAVVLSTLLLLTVLAPVTVGSVAAAGNEEADGLTVGVSQGADRVTASVSNASDGTPVEGANVSIASDGAYNAAGVTGATGIAAFDAPNETVNATVTAEKNGTNVTQMVTLRASEGEGPATTPFGQQVSAYVQSLLAGDGFNKPMGLLIADFASGDAGPPDDAGPPEDAGPPDDTDAASDNESADSGPPDDGGPPDDAGPPDDGGPPDDAGPPDDGGPPDDAGPPDDGGPPDDAGPSDGDGDDGDGDGPPDDAGPPDETGPL